MLEVRQGKDPIVSIPYGERTLTPLLAPGSALRMFCKLMLGRFRKLACGVGPGVGTGVAGVSWLATFCTVLMSVLAASFWSPPFPLHNTSLIETLLAAENDELSIADCPAIFCAICIFVLAHATLNPKATS